MWSIGSKILFPLKFQECLRRRGQTGETPKAPTAPAAPFSSEGDGPIPVNGSPLPFSLDCHFHRRNSLFCITFPFTVLFLPVVRMSVWEKSKTPCQARQRIQTRFSWLTSIFSCTSAFGQTLQWNSWTKTRGGEGITCVQIPI